MKYESGDNFRQKFLSLDDIGFKEQCTDKIINCSNVHFRGIINEKLGNNKLHSCRLENETWINIHRLCILLPSHKAKNIHEGPN